jgi:zinc transport system substrate-binding protein
MRPILLSLLLLPGMAQAEPPRVVTDLPVIGSLVAQVMGDLGSPEVLLESGGDGHHYQLLPSQSRALQDAGLVVWMGPEMTPWLDRALESGSDATLLTLLEAPETRLREFADDKHGDEATEHEDHDEHGGADPHAWLDPANADAWLDLIAAALARQDPDNAATYAANAIAAQTNIAVLDARISDRLAPFADLDFGVAHDAYGYFTEHFGLRPAVAVALGDAAAPGAARLAAIRDRLSTGDLTCLFPEVQHDPKTIATLAEGTKIRIGAPLDPSGSSLTAGPTLYQSVIDNMATTLIDCLSQGQNG